MNRIESKHNRFYSSVARYYSGLFPLNPAQLMCIENELGSLKGCCLLDVGCGSGNLAYGLAGKGALVTAIDLNVALLSEAKNNRNHQNITYRKADMLHIARLFGRAKFDGVICFGNTLVHLSDIIQMRDFFNGVHTVLKQDGVFFIQILNYDYIFLNKTEELPTIDNETVRFERKYRFNPESRIIRFGTRLTIKYTGEVIENETDLLGIGRSDLLQLLNIAAFSDIQMYADFKKTPTNGNHLPLVGVCRKT